FEICAPSTRTVTNATGSWRPPTNSLGACMPGFRVGAWLDLYCPMDQITPAGQEAEAAGYDGIWVADHFMGNTGTEERSDDGVHECFSVLAGLATVVPRVRLGSM